MFATLGIGESALACDPRGHQSVEVVITTQPTQPSAAATAQSQTFLAEAVRLEAKAIIEENASATVLLSARVERRKAASIRVQAGQVSEASQAGLLAKAEKLEAEAAAHELHSATFLSRARLIRARAKGLRSLSSRVLASGAVSFSVLSRIELPAPPKNHPDKSPVRVLEAFPKVSRVPMVLAGI